MRFEAKGVVQRPVSRLFGLRRPLSVAPKRVSWTTGLSSALVRSLARVGVSPRVTEEEARRFGN